MVSSFFQSLVRRGKQRKAARQANRKPRLFVEQLEVREVLTAFTPGNLVILQAGDGTTAYNAQGPLFLNEIGTTTAATGLVGITGTSADGAGNVTVTTTGTQNFSATQKVQISGVQVGANLNSPFNGVFSIATVNNAGNSFTYSDPAAAGLTGTPAPTTASATGGAWAYALVQQNAIPAVGGVGKPANQPITIDLSAAAGNGQLTRSYDGAGLNFDGIDSTVNNGGLTPPATPTGQNNRDIAVLSGDPAVASNLDTTTQGAFYVGDDNRGSVAETPGGQMWSAGHPNQAGGAVSQGVHYFSSTGPSVGTQVSASTNIRGINIGYDNRLYFSTAGGLGGATILNTAGIFTDAQALPTNPTPVNDIQVVPALFGASKLGGIFFADVNGDGIVDNGDKLYFLDDGTVGGAGTGGLYVATWNDSINWNAWNTPNNVAAAAAGFVDHWSVPVRLGDAPVQNGAGGVGQLRGLAGTVLANGTVDLYTTAYDNSAQDNAIIQQWVDPNAGVAITSASEVGNTVTITTQGTPNWVSGVTQVQIDGVVNVSPTSNGLGAAALNAGYNGVFTVTGSGNTWTYTDNAITNAATITNAGAAQQIASGTIIAEANSGSDPVAGKNFGDVGLRGVAFAPVAATSVTLSQSPANPLTPGAGVTLTAALSNPQAGVNLNGDVVTFIDQNTNTVLGSAVVGASVSNQAILNLPTGVAGNHFIQAYFAGGGVQALASARSNTIQVIEAGQADTFTTVSPNLSAAAVGKQVTLTATVITGATPTFGATGTVSFYNGSVSTANLIGTSSVNSTTGVATLNTAFSTAGAQTIIAVYNGDATFASTQSTTTVTVAANATATITSSANNVSLNATPTYTATIIGNSTVGAPTGTVTFTLTSATTGAVVGTSAAIPLTGSGNSPTATWSNAPALSSPGSYFVTLTYAPGTGSGYNAFSVDTISSGSGTAFVETVKQAFTPGNLIAVQRGDGNINLGSSGYLVFLDEYTTGGTLVLRVALPNLDAGTTHALLLSGQNGGEGLLNRSANGQFLTVAGYDVPVGRTFLTSTFPYQFPRTIALIDGTAGVNTTTAIGVANPNGSGVPASIKSATATGAGTGQTVTITLNSANYFLAGERVTITGITDGASGTAYDGAFTVTASTSTTLSYLDPNNITSTTPTVSSATAASPASVPYNPTDVVTNDGQSFYLGSNLPVGDTIDSGILFVGSVGATTATEIGPVGTGSSAISISGGQLVNVTGSGNVTTVGTGLPTSIGQTLNPLPSLAQNYDLFYHNTENAEQVLLLNTNDGSTINPNVAYVADQANGLLKFTLFSASSVSLTDPGTGTVTATYAGSTTFVAGQFVNIANASDPTFNGNFLITSAGAGTFTFSRGGTTAGTAAGASATEWVYGNSGGLGVFGQKLVFAGGVTAVIGNVVNPGPSAQVQLYVTGVNVQQQNPNQIDSFLDTNGATAGFPSGNFTKLAFVGGTPSVNPASPNANENFAGLAFAPGFATITSVAVAGNATSGYTVTATVTDPTGGGNVPTGAVYFYLDGSSTPFGSSLLNGGGVATLTIAAGALTGEHSFTAVYQGDVKDDQSTGVSGQALTAGNLIATVSATGANANGAATSISEFQTTGGAAVQTINLPTTGLGELTEKGNTTSEGYITDSADGHSASVAGYLVDAGSSTSGATAAIAVLQANGSISTTTQIASSDIGGSVRAAVSADGLGFWVASGSSLRYVPFGNNSSTPSVVVNSYYPSPSTVEIQSGSVTGNPGLPGGTAGAPGTLYITGAAGSPGGGLSSIDGPAEVLGGLATVAGQVESTLGNGGGTDFNTGRDANNNFPATNQIAISPDGLTIFVADSRTDGSGGILEYFDTLGNGSWTLVGQAQVDATTDGGLVGLVADFSTPSAPVLYATTSGTTTNRIEKITGGTTDGNTPAFSFTTLETSGPGTLFHGVAFAPTAPGATATTTTASVTGSPGAYPGGLTLSATVTGGATPTGYVSFQTASGVEIGSAPLVGGTATLTPSSNFQVANSGTFKAVYTGDATHAGSSDNTHSATATLGATTTTLTAQFLSIATNVTDNLSAQVTFTGSNAAPTGTVTFWQDAVGTGTNLGSAPVVATVVNVANVPTLEFLASGVSDRFTSTGSHPIFAVYSGNSNFATSTSASQTVLVVLSPTIVVTTNNANPGNGGVGVTETVTVSGTGGTPTGFVQFYDNLLPVGSPVLLDGTGKATVTLTTSATQGTDGSGNQFLLPGTQSITAVYSGNATYFAGTGVNQQAVQATAFGAGDKFVYRVGDGINSLDAPTGSTVQGAIGSTIYIDEINPTTGNIVQSIILPSNDGTGTQASIHAIVGNGQQSTTEQLSVDGANSALWLTGYDTNPLLGVTVSTGGVVSGAGTLAPGIPTVSGSITRAVGRVTTAGVVQDVTMTATNSGSGFGNFNAVFSPDGNQFYTAGNGGISYFSSFNPASGTVTPTARMTSPTGTTTALEPDGNNLAIIGPPGFGNDGPQVFTGFPTAAASASSLPGFSDTNATTGGQASTFYVDAYFTHLDNAGHTAPAGINTFYLSDDGPSFAHGAITKWSLVGGTWVVTDLITANGTAPNPVTYYYISGQTLSEGPGSSALGNVTLYVTYGNGGNADTGPGQLFSITDNSGYNAVGLTAGAVINQTGATSKEVYRGVAAFSTTDLTGTPASPISATEGTALTNVQVATFTDPDDTVTAEPGSSYTVSINWGDGATSAGTAAVTSTDGSGSHYSVTGTHTYATSTATGHPFSVSVSIVDPAWAAKLILNTTATVGVASTPFNKLTGAGVPVAATVTVSGVSVNGPLENTSFTAPVATFTDTIPNGGSPNPVGTYTATINWGDGTATSTGTITLGTATGSIQTYKVSGTHTYAEDSVTPYAVSVTITSSLGDANPLVVNTTANVGEFFGAQDVTFTQGANFNATQGVSYSSPAGNPLATFTDVVSNGGTADPASHYTTTIHWGDGTTSAGTVTSTGNTGTLPVLANYRVDGSHTYQTSGNFTVTVDIVDLSDPTTTLTTTPGQTATVAASTTFQFDSATYNTVSDPGTVTLVIDRTQGSGNQSVAFYTTDGTATSGTDYTAEGTQPSPIVVNFTGTQTQASITVPISLFTGAPYSGARSFTVTLENPSAGTSLGAPTTATVNITDPPLQETAVTATSSGFVLTFNRQYQSSLVHLYDTTANGATLTPASLTLKDGGGNLVYGTLVTDPSLTKATFVVSNENSGHSDLSPLVSTLTPGANYSLSLVGGAGGFEGQDGRALTGTSTFTVTPPAATNFTVSVPDVVRGAGESVTAPKNNTVSGLPLYVSSGNGTTAITAVTFTLTYDPSILTINSGAATLSSAFSTAGFTISPSSTYSAGKITLILTGGSITPAAGAQIPAVYITSSVPTGSALGRKAVLDLTGSLVNGAAATLNNGVDVDAYLGDVTGTGALSPADVTAVARVSAGFGQNTNSNEYVGFALPTGATGTSYKDIDPALLGDFSQHTGQVGPTDVTGLARFVAGSALAPNTITTPPSGGNPVTGGVDPYVYIEPVSAPSQSTPATTPTGTTGQGSPITYAVHIFATQALTDYDAAGFAIQFDQTKFQISNVTTNAGGGFTTTDNGPSTYNASGRLHVVLSTGGAGLPLSQGQDVVAFTFTVTPNTNTPAGTYTNALHLLASDGTFQTQVFDGNDPTVLSPAPVNGTPNGQIDGSIQVVAVSGAFKLSQQTINAAVGQTFTVSINYLNGPSQIDYDASGTALKFDPTKLQIVSDSNPNPTNLTLTDNGAPTYNTSGVLHVVLSTGGVGQIVNANTTLDTTDVTFQVLPGASGQLQLTLLASDGTFITQVDDNGTNVPLASPTSNNFDPTIDATVTVVVNPNLVPYDAIATTLPSVLFNPGAAAGLHTATTNKETFSGASAITVSDPNITAGYAETDTTTISVTGDTQSTQPVGTLALSGAVANLTVSGNGTGTNGLTGATSITLVGQPTDINNALNGATYQPGAGYFGTTTLTVTTSNSGNPNLLGPGGFNTGFSDTRTRTISVVGLFLSEVNLFRNSTTAVSNTQYLELYSTAPNFIIPTSVFVIGINGDRNATGAAVGTVQDILKLGGFETGSNGFLTLLESGQPYTNTSNVVAAGTTSANTGSGTNAGFGNTGSYNSGPNGNTLTGVHVTAANRTGRTPTEFIQDLESASASYLLVETTTTTPTIGASIDGGSTTTATVAGGTFYNSLNVLDGVGILRNANGSGGADRSYAPITFKGSANTTGTTIASSAAVTTGFSANYVGRIGQSSTDTSSDWLASVATGSNGTLALGTGTNSTAFGGQTLDNISGPNFWAPELTVLVNDGSSPQHSMVDELTLNFNEPVSIANLQGDFVVKDASGNVVTTVVAVTDGTDNGDGTASNVKQLVITFNTDASADTYSFTGTDPFGNTRGLVDGNFFLNTVAADVTNHGFALDGAHNGVAGSTSTGTGNLNGNGVNEVDEFWRLFGDVNGTRFVDGLGAHTFGTTNGSTSVNASDTVVSASENQMVVTLVTSGQAGFVVGQRVTISGIAISGSTNNGYNGTFTIATVTNNADGTTTITYTATTAGLAVADANTGSIASPAYLWYLDFNQDGNIDADNTLDSVAFFNNRFGINGGHQHLPS